MESNRSYSGLEIAIIGISCRFPESDDHRQFWENLRNGREMIRTFTEEELRKRGVPETWLQNKSFVRSDGYLSDKNHFDHSFFGYSTEEASYMDPQIRLFHEICWSALEDAGYSSLSDTKKIGLFAGASTNDNWKIHVRIKSGKASLDPFYLNMLMSQNFISTLVSYKLNLRGPSYYVDTTCSTSLSAVHLACRSLLTKECALALAGGVCISTVKRKGYIYRENMIVSSDGHCRAFDKDASGAISGEGAGVVVLKRLQEAIKDNDHIYSVIRASSVNNDGSNKVGYTAPGVNGQADCIAGAQKLAGIDPRGITYIESHGTGTKLGDPVEIKGLNKAFGVGGDAKYCAIGSVKTNIGHLDTAAGVAGLIKTALALKHKQIPPSLHFKEANPDIDFAGGPFYVNAQLQEWKRTGDAPLRAGVSSFGIGGTNAHAVLEEAPDEQPAPAGRDYKILTLSARSQDSLLRYTRLLKDFLHRHPSLDEADMAYTLQLGRKHFSWRLALVFRNKQELVELLDNKKAGEQPVKSREPGNAVVFMFPGQGSQYVNMAKGLYHSEPSFRQLMNEGFAITQRLTGEDLSQILFCEDTTTLKINQTIYTQPILFLVEYSLARLLMSVGIQPAWMIGHSIGEYVAACISGVFGLEDALKLVVKRAALMNAVAPGSMLSVAISSKQAAGYLDSNVSLAAVNGPSQVVLSGDTISIEALATRLLELDIPCVLLHTSHAFHSSMQQEIIEPFMRHAAQVTFCKPVIPFISNVTGTFITEQQACSPAYWAQHLLQTVQFGEGLQTLLSVKPDPLFIECGPGHSLSALLKQQQPAALPITLMRSIKQTGDDEKYFAKAIAVLWARGATINWRDYYGQEKRRRVSLPTYSFEPVVYPVEVNPFENGPLHTAAHKTNKEMKDWIYYPSWKRSVLFTGANTTYKTFLLLHTNEPATAALSASLLKRGHRVVEVFTADVYKKLAPYRYTVDPAGAEDFNELITELKSSGIVITDIVYAWATGPDLKEDIQEDKMHLPYFSLARLIRAISTLDSIKGTKLVLLTRRLHQVSGTEKSCVLPSLLIGMINSVSQEHGIAAINIDIDDRGEATAEQLCDELEMNPGNKERTIALRHPHRWVQHYQPHEQELSEKDSVIKAGGIYLITGGLGNAGFALATHLVTRHHCRLVLTGRKELQAGSEAMKRWHELTKHTADLKYFSADVADYDAMKSLIEETEASWGTISGLIHTAGIIDNSFFEMAEDITTQNAMAMFRPKVIGIRNLYKLFKDRSPDFVWVTSSIATILGGLGFSSYAAANAYMDHFISSNQLHNWKSVCLPGLSFAADAGGDDSKALTAAQLSTLFDWSITMRGSNVIIISKEDLTARIKDIYTDRAAAIKKEEEQQQPITQKQERPDISADLIAPVTLTEIKLKQLFEDFFAIDNIGTADNFFELGGDSLKGMVLLKRIKKEFDVNITLKEFLEMQNVQLIASYIDEVNMLLQQNKNVSGKTVVI